MRTMEMAGLLLEVSKDRPCAAGFYHRSLVQGLYFAVLS